MREIFPRVLMSYILLEIRYYKDMISDKFIVLLVGEKNNMLSAVW